MLIAWDNATEARPLVLFDGACHLCHRTVQWILRNDRSGRICFAPLQGTTARRWVAETPLHKVPDSVLLWYEGRLYARSEAVLRIAKLMGGPWRWLYVLRWVPQPLRDAVYGVVARYRYRWFGRSEQCWLPDPTWANRFAP
jgi:predicted DCC family thiol-disulfide oxidoreductase YuxK